jgi:GcrA cell cycle regulator
MKDSSTWLPEWTEALTRLHEAGLSASAIAQRLTELFQREFTRNSIIGKRARCGITSPLHEQRRRQLKAVGERRARTRAPLKPKVELPKRPPKLSARAPSTASGAPALVPAEPVDLYHRKSKQCRWPINDGAPFLFCGAPRAGEHSYCAHHQYRSLDGVAARRFLESLP